MDSLGLQILKSFESCSLKAYPDPASGGEPWTCGWGSTGDGIGPSTTWTQEEADARLDMDWGRTRSQVLDLVTVPLNDNQIDALTDFTYNEGVGNLRASTLLAHINAGIDDVPMQFERWHYAAGKSMRGLLDRRKAEAALFTGDLEAVRQILTNRGSSYGS